MPDENNDNDTTPVTSVDFQHLVDQKTDDGLNLFTDEHIQKLNAWNSSDPTKAKFRNAEGKLDVAKLTKGYMELETRLGKLAKPLSETATEQERFEYRKHLQQVLGVPDTPDGYEIVPPNLPEGMKLADEDINALKIAMHKHNGSRDLVQAVVDMGVARDVRRMQSEINALKEQNKEVEAHLKAAWGPEEFAKNDNLLQQYLHDFAPTEEEFDALFQGLQETRFAGGAKTKETVYKALCKAAEMAKGQGATLYGDLEQKTNEQEQLKRRFPKSYKFLSS